jgi:hypothetical protein
MLCQGSAALVDVLIVELAERLDRDATAAPATRRRALLARVQTFIVQRLADPELSPSMIAAAHHIARRYLYQRFEMQQATVSGWIRQRRLEMSPRPGEPTSGGASGRRNRRSFHAWSRSLSARSGVHTPARVLDQQPSCVAMSVQSPAACMFSQ